VFILRKKYFHCLLLSILLIISGCYDNEDIDRRVIVNPIGIDSESGGKMLISFRMFLISPGRGSSSPADQNGKNFIVRTSLASGIFPALNDIQVQDEHNIFMGQCRAIIFGETQAKNGLHQALDFINRTPTFPPNAFVVIGRPTATAIQNGPIPGNTTKTSAGFFQTVPIKNMALLNGPFSGIFTTLCRTH
jgi:spore germination protein KC